MTVGYLLAGKKALFQINSILIQYKLTNHRYIAHLDKVIVPSNRGETGYFPMFVNMSICTGYLWIQDVCQSAQVFSEKLLLYRFLPQNSDHLTLIKVMAKNIVTYKR